MDTFASRLSLALALSFVAFGIFKLMPRHAWKLLEDSDMLPGGCRVKTPISYVDASMERQVELLLGALLAACEDDAGA